MTDLTTFPPPDAPNDVCQPDDALWAVRLPEDIYTSLLSHQFPPASRVFSSNNTIHINHNTHQQSIITTHNPSQSHHSPSTNPPNITAHPQTSNSHPNPPHPDMNCSPYQWRANTGYLPSPDHPAPLCTSYPTFTSPSLPQPGYAHQLYYPSSGQILAIPPPPPPQPKKEEKKVENLPPPPPPTTVATTSKTLVTPTTCCTCTTTYNPLNRTWTTICKCPSPPTPEPKKKPASLAPTMSHSLSPSMPPPTLRPGENYMFPPEHTMLHVFNKAAPIWEPKYAGQGLAFKIFKVATSFSVGNVVEKVLKKKTGEECEGWCVTEAVEVGEGKWIKGTSVKWGSERAKGTLGGMGWGGKRGVEGPPVWVVVHKD